MDSIKSVLTVAQLHATQFSEKGSSLTSLGDVSKDDATTVAGNEKAHEVLDLTKAARQQLSELMRTASTNIHSVAEGFQAADSEQAAGIKLL